ncbi:uncharacterized protein METZ01_LOCUS479634, partial [marine metagenome]
MEILYSELSQVLEPIANWEIIIVDDGSDDDSFPVLKKMVNEDSRIVAIRFFKNF